MDYTLSKSEKKRLAKNIEHLAMELAALSPADIAKLPADDVFKQDISEVKNLKAGARKRKIKYIAKYLRSIDPEPFFTFLTEKKGSKLKEKREFQELERLRDDIVTTAIAAYQEADEVDEPPPSNWECPAVSQAVNLFPSLTEHEIRIAAMRYAVTRKTTYSKELFRMLKAAQEQQKFATG